MLNRSLDAGREIGWNVSFRTSRSALFTAKSSQVWSLIKDEFDAFLDCGILAHDFLRLHYDEG